MTPEIWRVGINAHGISYAPVLACVDYYLRNCSFYFLDSFGSRRAVTLGLEEWCVYIPGLNSAQVEICNSTSGLQTAIQTGLLLAVEECEHEFKYSHWNCNLLDSRSLLHRAPGIWAKSELPLASVSKRVLVRSLSHGDYSLHTQILKDLYHINLFKDMIVSRPN